MKEGVSLLRWLVILIICVIIGKRTIQLGHWARYLELIGHFVKISQRFGQGNVTERSLKATEKRS